MAKEPAIEKDGVVSKAYRGAMFEVTLEDGHKVMCGLCGKIKKHFIKVMPGDRVIIEMSHYDLTKGRIVYREK